MRSGLLANAGLLLLTAAPAAGAVGDPRFVLFADAPGAVRMVRGGVAAPILVDPQDHAGVRRAAGDLREDVFRVTGIRPAMEASNALRAADVVVIGTLGRSQLVDGLVRSGQLDVRDVQGRWEASVIQVVSRPWPGVERALIVAGSDKRGTIFGIYDVSEQIGVSPWYWWADVPVRPRPELFARAVRTVRAEPAVRYRGIFINDEAPALSGWARETFGGFNHRFYARVFELLLRLRANFLWPAMWGSAFADDDPGNPRLADEYGIVIGTSHHEPLMRAHDEWRRHGQGGAWSYATNAVALREFWRQGLLRSKGYEKVVTLGMRGDGDEPMSRETSVALLERIVADQRRIVAETVDADVTRVPQVWALYKEVQDYYEKGMRVPDDVTLLWCDDNWGNIRRLPTPEERGRAGGAGVYYHFDYVGGPRSYKWINTVPLPKVWEQMHLAWRYGATRLWIVNVGDIKPMELPVQFLLDYAWDPGRWPAEGLAGYTRAWAEREFGPEHAPAIADIVSKYTKYNGRRKPEMLEPRTYSLVSYGEADAVVEDYRRLAERAEGIHAALPAAHRDAFFQLVLYPVQASAVVNDLYVTAGRNRLHAAQGRASTNGLAERTRELFREDARLTREYNEVMAGGKWKHMMDQTRIGYTFWNQPPRNAMPAAQEVLTPEPAEMGVAVEGSEGSWPGSPGQPTLPVLSVFDGQVRWLEVFNRGRRPFAFKIETAEPWLVVHLAEGTVEREQRIAVAARWDAVPIGATSASLTLSGSDGTRIRVQVPLLNPPAPRPETVDGFVEADGYVSIDAEHFTDAVAPPGREWKRLPDHGRTLSAMTPWPVTPWPAAPLAESPRLDYRMYLFTAGEVSVDVYLSPTQKFQPGPGLRFGLAFDDEAPQWTFVHADESLAAWERSVADGVTRLTTRLTVARPGYHVLKFWAADPGLVLQKLVVNTGAMRPSYLGPPPSFRH